MSSSSESSAPPFVWPVLAVVALLVAALVAAGFADFRRAKLQLARLETQACSFELPPNMLKRIDRLIMTTGRGSDEWIETFGSFSSHLTSLVKEAHYARMLVELGEHLRWMHERHPTAPEPFLRKHWGAHIVDGGSAGCRGVRSGDELLVARQLVTPGGRRVVVVFYVQRR